MALDTYTDLVTEVGEYLDRPDLAARVPTFVRLSEARLNRVLDDPDMEVAATVTASGALTALPADFGSMVSVNTGGGFLEALGPVQFAGLDHTVMAAPRFYSISTNGISFAPGNSTALISMVYRRRIPALTAAAPTNWLLTRAPDVYLYGALLQASAFLVEDDRLGLWKSAFDEAIAELRTDGARRKWGAGPIAPRIGRT